MGYFVGSSKLAAAESPQLVDSQWFAATCGDGRQDRCDRSGDGPVSPAASFGTFGAIEPARKTRFSIPKSLRSGMHPRQPPRRFQGATPSGCSKTHRVCASGNSSLVNDGLRAQKESQSAIKEHPRLDYERLGPQRMNGGNSLNAAEESASTQVPVGRPPNSRRSSSFTLSDGGRMYSPFFGHLGRPKMEA